jgi:glucose-6-phosphate isomerase
MTAEAAGLFLDYSKNRVTDETLKLLLQLAAEAGLRERIDAMFKGEKINITENRAVLHVALRAPKTPPSWWTARTWCPRFTRSFENGRYFRQASAAAPGRATPASAFATSSTSASAARTSARSWLTRRSSITASAR